MWKWTQPLGGGLWFQHRHSPSSLRMDQYGLSCIKPITHTLRKSRGTLATSQTAQMYTIWVLLGGQMDDLSSEFGAWGFKPPLTKLKSMGWMGNALYVGIWKGKSSGHWWLSQGHNQIITKPSCFCLGSVEWLIWLSLAHFTSLWTYVYIVYSDSSGELM